ncbi:hypothetical protein KAW65_06885 [candidate division WOR-3 bacterium]|nr:hypothetical protein [candidate division WOR-3 bacterium]
MYEISSELLKTALSSALAYIISKGLSGKDQADQIKKQVLDTHKDLLGEAYPSPEELEKLTEEILKHPPDFSEQVSVSTLARWFEVPEEEFPKTRPEELDTNVLTKHIYLESLFSEWFKAWDYKVGIGEELKGISGLEFRPDVYAELDTIHGTFQVIVNFVCDNPPSKYRVLANLQALEYYATKGHPFGEGDIFIVATPYSFPKEVTDMLALENERRDYFILCLESEELYDLYHARDDHDRLKELQERVSAVKELKEKK